MSPLVAAGLSLLCPGLGQLGNGDRAKGWSLVALTVGVGGGMWLAVAGPPALRSHITVVILGFAAPFLWIPAVVDAWQRARGRPDPILSRDEPWYTVLMLATVGPMALPLLWQSRRLGRGWKVALTLLTVGLALLGILAAVVLGPRVGEILRELERLGAIGG